MPRNRRPKTRLMGGMSDDQRVELRQKALDMASKGLGPSKGVTRRGPVHEGSPGAQKASADRMAGEKRMARDRKAKARFALGGSAVSPFVLHKNTTGNERAGRTFRSYARPGGVVHDYGDRRVFVKKDTGGTGNTARPRSGSNTSDEMHSLALQRAKSKRGGMRRYFSRTG